MSDYEEKEAHYFHGFPIQCTGTEGAALDRRISGWSESIEMEVLLSRRQWAWTNGTEDRAAELETQIMQLKLRLYDMVERWAQCKIPESY